MDPAVPKPVSLKLGLACALLATAVIAATPDPLDEARELHRSGHFAAALAAYREVAATSSDAATRAIARNNACLVLIHLTEHAAALDECRTALVERRRLGDDRGTARTLHNLGLALRYLGRYDEAELAYREALAINERRGDAESQVLNLSNLGMVAVAAGDYGDAMRRQAAAEALAERHSSEPWAPRRIVIAKLNQGVALEKLGAYREALDLLRDLAATMDDGDPGLTASVQVNLGVIYRNLGDPISAVASFAEAGAVYEKLGDVAALSNVKLNLALALHLNLGRLAEAERAYREALALARESGDRSEEIQDLHYLGHVELELGRGAAAEESFRRCLELADDAGSTEGRWSGLYGLGRVTEERGDLGKALEHYRRAMAEIEQVRSSLGQASWRSGYFGDKRPVYAAAVRVLAALQRREPDAGYAGEALAVVERAKARELLESLGTPRRTAEPLGAAELRRQVGHDELALEYFQGEKDLFLWVIRADSVTMTDLGPVASIFDRVAEVHTALAAGRDPPAEAVAELSRTLLGDAVPLGDAARLRVAPDGTLFYLPFEILADPDSSGRLLLDRLAVTYLPSASTLALLDARRDAGPAPLRLAGFADPELPADPSQPRSPASLLVARYGFGRLPAAARELAAVGRILGGEQELEAGDKATEEAFRTAVTRGARVVHVASHTLLDERPGQGAVVVLAAGDGHDGLLYPEEISGLDYRADLTVLASCRSALGAIEDGRALASLTGSLLAAGSSAVVATLWDVGDEATAAFMEQFYYQLHRGLDAEQALRRAKLRLRADPGWNQPGLWAAYVLVGRGTVVVNGAEPPIWVWVLATGALAAAIALWRLRRR